jgi:predicted permease
MAAVFSITRTILLTPLPIAHEEQVGVFWFSGSWNESEFIYLQPRFQGFTRVAVYRPDTATLEVGGGPLRLVEGLASSSELFDVLGAPPMLGRTLRVDDDRVGAEPVSVLSYRLWQELGSDPSILGKTLRVGGVDRRVIGVMPRTFWFPAPTTRIWNAAALDANNRSGRYTLIARAASGSSTTNMAGPLRVVTSALAARYRYPAQWDKTKAPAITPVREFLVGDISPGLQATFAAMAMILLMACANVAALLLGQLDTQRSDMAVRAALGADRRRLIQQAVLESFVIALIAGLAGAALAAAGFTILVGSMPLGNLADRTQLDWTVFWASMIASVVSAACIAVLAGFSMWRRDLQSTIATQRTGGIATRGERLEAGLVVVQVALAVLVTTGAGLLVRSVINLRAIDPGFDVERVAVVDTTMPSGLTIDQRRRTVLETVERLRSIPRVAAVAAVQRLPLRGSSDNWGINVKGRQGAGGTTAFRMITRDYFTAVGMRLIKGREFEPSDRATSERVVVINEALATKYFPQEDPIGRTLQTFDEQGERIIGIVANAAEASLTDGPVPARYMLYEQLPVGTGAGVSFVLRTDAPSRVPMIVTQASSWIRQSGLPLAIQKTTTTEEVFQAALGTTGRVVTLLSLLAGVALVLGAVGVYGVIAHRVARRSRDYGIRLALGDTPLGILREVIARSTALVLGGSAIGVVAAVPLTRLIGRLLYHVAPTDPLSVGATILVLVTIGGIAAFVPARRASVTDPVAVLRQL